MLPDSIAFLEAAELSADQRQRIQTARTLFAEAGRKGDSLSAETRAWFEELGIQFGLSNHGITADDLPPLADEAYADPCHATNLVSVTRDDLLAVYEAAQ
tara:strand:- start:478 stop:777 length:300 start_codon:yes stop_codon:yes gene_type:complete